MSIVALGLSQVPPSASSFFHTDKHAQFYNNTLGPHVADNERFFSKEFFESKKDDYRFKPFNPNPYPLFLYPLDKRQPKDK